MRGLRLRIEINWWLWWPLRCARLRLWWKQCVCAYRGHGHLYVVDNRISIFCSHCGFESPGLDLQTWRIRHLWMWERHRKHWTGRSTRATAS